MESIQFTLLLQFVLGLFAMVNPIGIVPVFVSLTSHMSPEERNKTAVTASLAVAIILSASLIVGQSLLDLFSISIDSFRVAGGFLLISIAFSMMSGKLGEDKQNKQEKTDYISREQVGVVPLAIPLMAGPGAISSCIVYATEYPSAINITLFAGVICLFCLGVWILLKSAPFIVRMLGQTGINVVTRIMGLILGSIGVEFVTSGLKALFPGWAG